MIKYQYAKDEHERLIKIGDVIKKDRNKYKFCCVACGKELIAKLGDIKNHHFAHKSIVECSGETYLHRLGKKLFYHKYLECLEAKKPFYIEVYQDRFCNHFNELLEISCKLSKELTKFNLLDFFDKIILEKKEDSFIPDLMLISKNRKDKIFIEIAVTHLSTEKKMLSGNRVIEIEIESEFDFEPIIKKRLSEKNSNLHFMGFRSYKSESSICKGLCQVKYDFVTLDLEGKVILKSVSLSEASEFLKQYSESIVRHFFTPSTGHGEPEIYKWFVAKCAKEDAFVRNCFICRYHAPNISWDRLYGGGTPDSIFCKFIKEKCNSNKAVTCQYFKQEFSYIKELYNMGQKYLVEKGLYDGFEHDDIDFIE